MNERPQATFWFDELWPRLVVASGIGYVAATYAISRWLTRRSPAPVNAPGWRHCTVESLICRTSDGVLLKGWCVEPARPRGTIALFHGMRLNRLHVLDRIQFLTAAGYRCVAFDHRAHGESAGRFCSFGYHERHDVAAVYELVRQRWPHEPSGGLGVSMGAAAICFAAEIARAFDALVIESVYAELANAFDQRIGCGYPGWFRHFRNGVVWLTERRLGASIAEVAPLAHVSQLSPRPVLVITGSDDPHAPPHEVRLLAEQIPANGQFHVIPGAGHGDVCSQGGPFYQDLLVSFFDTHLRPAQPSGAIRPPLAA